MTDRLIRDRRVITFDGADPMGRRDVDESRKHLFAAAGLRPGGSSVPGAAARPG